MEEIITNYQKGNIRKKLLINFSDELSKSSLSYERENFTRLFHCHIDILVNTLYNNGVMFYGFTISMPFLERNDPDFWYYAHLHVEGWLATLRTEVELIEFCYLSLDLKKEFGKNNELVLLNGNYPEGSPQIKGVLGVRSIIGGGGTFLNEIKKIFNIWKGPEVVVKQLDTVSVIKDYWFYVVKERNFKFHNFQYFSHFYQFDYGDLMDLELLYDDSHQAFDLNCNLDSKYSYLMGMNDRFPEKLTILNYLYSLYMNEEKMYLKDGNFFIKIAESKYSCKNIGSLSFLRRNNVVFLKKLIEKFPQQLGGLKISRLLNESFEDFYYSVEKNNHYLPSIEFKDNVIEFKDGVYFLTEDKFFNFDSLILQERMNGFSCKTFFCINYKNIGKPKNFLDFFGESNDSFFFALINFFDKKLRHSNQFHGFSFFSKIFGGNCEKFLVAKNKIDIMNQLKKSITPSEVLEGKNFSHEKMEIMEKAIPFFKKELPKIIVYSNKYLKKK